MRCFCPNVKNEDELISMIRLGFYDDSIYRYLIEIMLDEDSKILRYDPVDLFELQATLIDENELLCLSFWDKDKSGIYSNFKYNLSDKQEEIFDLFVLRINRIYESLKSLIV